VAAGAGGEPRPLPRLPPHGTPAPRQHQRGRGRGRSQPLLPPLYQGRRGRYVIIISSSKNLPVLRIRICRIHMFLGLLDPDPLIRATDPDPSIINQNY
jgi:hypothetical protein